MRAVHSLSGAYDSTLLVYTLRTRGLDPEVYFADFTNAHTPAVVEATRGGEVAATPTLTLLSHLKAHGVRWVLLSAP